MVQVEILNGTAWVRCGTQSTAIDGTDFPDNKLWKKAILKEVSDMLGNIDIEEGA